MVRLITAQRAVARSKLSVVNGQYADGAPGYAFISYVREDCERVNRLETSLKLARIRVWRDTADLWPGQDWKIEIRRAIMAGNLAFIACFSENTERRVVTYQNEELILAVEQIRLRPPGQPWLIPVRFAECAVPEFDLGAGRSLDSLHRVDLFDGSWEHDILRLVGAVQRILPAHGGAVGAPTASTASGPGERPATTRTAARPAPVPPLKAHPEWEPVIPAQPLSVDRGIVTPGISRRRVSSSAVFRVQLLFFALVTMGPFPAIRVSAGVAAAITAVLGMRNSALEWRREGLAALMRGLNSMGFMGFALILIIGAVIDYVVSPTSTSPGAMRNFEWAEGAWMLAWALGNAICAARAFVLASRRRKRAFNLILSVAAASIAIGIAVTFPALAIGSYALLAVGGSAFLVAFLVSSLALTNWVIRRGD